MSAAVRAAGIILYRKCKNMTDPIQFLLLKASYGTHHWSPPKGHVDPGENDLETALRETEEECGVKVEDMIVNTQKPMELNYTVWKGNKNKPKVVIYYPAELIDSNFQVKMSDEHEDFAWLNIEEACTTAAFDDLQKVLKIVYSDVA